MQKPLIEIGYKRFDIALEYRQFVELGVELLHAPKDVEMDLSTLEVLTYLQVLVEQVVVLAVPLGLYQL